MKVPKTLAVFLSLLALPITVTADDGQWSQACASLVGGQFADTPDAPMQITRSALVEATEATPEYCQVRGYVAPQIEFEARIPTETWNEKFLKRGCGGFCGFVAASACDPFVKRGYACIASDMGHTSTALDAKWAYNNTQAEIDFGYRATHAATVAGKVLTEALHSTQPERSYFFGCSTGGRQGLVSAQRFPRDFDGIIAGAPVINETGAGMQLLWSLVSLSPGGQPLVTGADLRLVHDKVIEACDANDGVTDGMIGDPRQCAFDIASIPGLAQDRADAIKKVYEGPTDSEGTALYTGGALKGSELNWIGPYIEEDGGYGSYGSFIGDLFRYLAFPEDPGPAWVPTDFDWDKDPWRMGAMETIYSGSNPDLRKFRDGGGKMIIFQGWRDQSVVPLNIIDYHEIASATMGGEAALDDFMRLFMMPGVNHCTGGVGADQVDYLSYLEAWVERGEAPDQMRAVKLNERLPFGASPEFPVAPEKITLSRPLYPYPSQPRFDGSGDANSEVNWGPN